jgi:hypothetical protein
MEDDEKFHEIIDADCEFLNSIIKTFSIPVDGLKKGGLHDDDLKCLSNILNLNMIKRKFNDKENKLDSRSVYKRDHPRFEKYFEILYHSGHFMIWEEKICTKLKYLKGKGHLEEIDSVHQNLAIRARVKSSDIQARVYSEYSCGPVPKRVPFRTTIDNFFMMGELSHHEKVDVKRKLSALLWIDVLKYPSLAALGQVLMHEAGCYKGVVGLRGLPAEFIRKCLCPIILGSPYGDPIRVEGEICQYDRKSSYPASYLNFPGIPMGKPIVINGAKDLSELNEQ